jgi:hypothetical protein
MFERVLMIGQNSNSTFTIMVVSGMVDSAVSDRESLAINSARHETLDSFSPRFP